MIRRIRNALRLQRLHTPEGAVASAPQVASKVLLAALALVTCGPSLRGQDAPALVEYYGDGVHTYFEGDMFDAYRLFSQAISGGSQDPRVYFFRGLTLLRMGRDLEAEADLRAGAYLEARAPGGAFDVDRSIQRIQGRHRLLLEKIRRQVRYEVAQQRRDQDALRYEETQRREEMVLRRERPQSYDEAVQPAAGAEAAPPPVGVLPPTGATPPTAEPSTGTLPGQGAAPPGDTPAPPVATPPGTRPPAADVTGLPPADADPFATETTPVQPTPPAEPPTEEFSAPPAQSDEPAEAVEPSDPFGGVFDEPAAEPAEDTPAADPFGGAFDDQPANGAPADPLGASEQPAEAAPSDPSDPFGGGEQPAAGAPAEAPDADPFGGGFPDTAEAPTGMPAAGMGAGPPMGAADLFRGLGFMLGQASNRARGGPTGAGAAGIAPFGGEQSFEFEATMEEPSPGGGDPFGGQDPGAGQEPFNAQDPFSGGRDAAGAGDQDEAEAPQAGEGDPFGAEGDPFGAAGGDPFGGDPFGPSGETPADDVGPPAATEQPDEDGSADPFGENPFG